MSGSVVGSSYKAEYLDDLVLDTFLTVTFREPMIGCDEGFRRLKQFFKRLNKEGDEYYRKLVRGFAVAERQGRQESIHIHCVLEGIYPNKMRALKRKCQDVFGNTEARIYDHSLPRQATDYLAEKCADGRAEGFIRFTVNSKWRGE